VRVDADRLDLMVDTIGELVIAAAMIGQDAGLRSAQSVGLVRNLDHLDKICRELQQIGMSLRMVPVRPTFQKMARLVRDLASRSSREIEFVMAGEDTELDKSVVDKIGDPLVHMLRNAVDHGIEADEHERRLAGKPAQGRIELRALHKGGNIIIEVEDDGRGLDRDAIVAKAVERGLVKEGAVLGDREIFALIFEPGFSTAKQVTDVSGRGVGMDVVRRNVEELRGAIEISSTPGRGSVFRFKLPLTLAIIDGMVVLAGGERYIIPTLNVVRLVRPGASDYSTVLGRGEMLDFEGALIPLLRVNRLFGIKHAREDLTEAVVVVVESDGRRVGLLTDDLVGQQQIVIKNLGDRIQGTEGLAGGAIMSDGNVALIIDIAGLVKLGHAEGGLHSMARACCQSVNHPPSGPCPVGGDR
jgi:two-component system chemotaxis sensor kinase CheA